LPDFQTNPCWPRFFYFRDGGKIRINHVLRERKKQKTHKKIPHLTPKRHPRLQIKTQKEGKTTTVKNVTHRAEKPPIFDCSAARAVGSEAAALLVLLCCSTNNNLEEQKTMETPFSALTAKKSQK
jgi:hypothetical protein